MTKYVYDFHEGNKDMKDLLGGKGANLAEMTNMGLPVPHGFTITTEACLAYLAGGGFPDGLIEEVDQHVATLEASMGKNLGDPSDPLLVSVRSGAKFSMPGMMDTVLNLGLDPESTKGLAEQSDGDVRFALDAYRRFIQMFGKIVMDVPGEAFEEALDDAKERKGEGATDTDLDASDLEQLVGEFLGIYHERTGQDFPIDPREQMRLAIEAVFKSWNGKRAIDYRRQNKISDDLGTAVNVQAMVFGNRGDDSGTGVAFTRDPATGEKVPYGDYLGNAQGEDVVAGIRNTLPLADLAKVDPTSHAQLLEHMATLEGHYRDMCDIEFTIEKGRLWILQTRVGKRTAVAEWAMAYDMLNEGLIDEDEALLRPEIRIVEDPLRPRGLRSRPFDGEGVACAPRTLVEDGRVTGWLTNVASAAQLGLPLTGHASRSGGGAPAVGTSNIDLLAGEVSVDELIADIEDGVLVDYLIGQGIDMVSGNYSRGAAGHRIVKGRIEGPVAGFTIAGNLIEMFASLRAADDLEHYRPVNAPTLRVDGMTVAAG